MSETDVQRARLLWQCRRGMRELDLMLNAYVETRYHELDTAGVQRLEQLLGYPDQVLLEVLMGRQPPADPALAELARAIREAAGHS